MTSTAASVLAHLHAVNAERAARLATPGLNARALAVKAYQQARFANMYADLLVTPRYEPAARFFLDELYGPKDFTQRDAQFAKVVPALVRLFPSDVVHTVGALAELHALSESLDSSMALQLRLDGQSVRARAYAQAWQACGRADERERQIALTGALGHSLDRLTRKPLLQRSLRLMRGAAHAAGLGELQQLLERGFEAFRVMHGAQEFLEVVLTRERRLCAALFTMDMATIADADLPGLPPSVPSPA